MRNITVTTVYRDKSFKVKNIIVNGSKVGVIYRQPKTDDTVAYWSGEVQNHRDEEWRISEYTIKDVEKRVKEAYEK